MKSKRFLFKFTAGFVLIVPRTQIQPLGLSGSEAMAFALSGGVSGAGVAK